MGNGIDDEFTGGFQRILEIFLACHRLTKLNAFAEMIDHEHFGAANLVRKCAADVLPGEGIAHGFAGKTSGGNICATHEALRVFAKQQNPGIGWTYYAILLRPDSRA